MCPRLFIRAAVAFFLVALIVALGATAPASAAAPLDDASAPAQGDPTVPGIPVSVGTATCGTGWSGGAAGPVTFAFYNGASVGLDVYLQDVATQKLYLEIESFGPGSTLSASVSLAAGTYQFLCVTSDLGSLVSAPISVAGTYDGPLTPGVLPVSNNDLIVPAIKYTDWVASRLPVLRKQVAALTSALRQGRIATAKQRWLTAHMTYERLGAAYDAFGPDNAAINALPRTDVSPLEDKHLRGFHKIEALLWHGVKPGAIAPYGAKLQKAIANLQVDFDKSQFVGTNEVGLRAHEILENALQFELSGRSDAGSHTALATIDANIDGTRQALKYLRALLKPRDADMPATDQWLDRLQKLVESYRKNGSWTALTRLTSTQRAQIDAVMSQTLELLSEVAVITTPVPGVQVQ